jgi:nicotinamide riboside transporter PnuC
MESSLTNIVGHIGYCLWVTGTLLLARKAITGWLLRIVGDVIWIIIGFILGMSSIWFWCLVFLGLDTYGYFSWRRKQKPPDAQL